MSFANQALSAEYMAKNAANLPIDVYDVPLELDQQVASLKLEAMGLNMDILSDEQAAYLAGWEAGT
jgi:adenosylhomocysteinase